MRQRLLAIGLAVGVAAFSHRPADAAEAFWLDQHNALLYLGTFGLDAELKAMKAKGANTLLLHADVMPAPLVRFIAWRAKETAEMDTVAWIQKPNRSNLTRAGSFEDIKAVQIDDHFFNKPPLPIQEFKTMLETKELWCSFQPRQFNWQTTAICDQNDIQIYRKNCSDTINIAWSMGIIGQPNIAIATYADGSQQGDDQVRCLEKNLATLDSKLFVFKWKNQEVWSKRAWKALQSLKRLRPSNQPAQASQ